MLVARVIVACALALALGCNKKQGPKPGNGDSGPATTAACDSARNNVTAIYAADPALAALEDAALRADLLAANVDMALRDCAVEPDRIAPCLIAAADVGTIERDCLIPLDDSGQIEHRAFGAVSN